MWFHRYLFSQAQEINDQQSEKMRFDRYLFSLRLEINDQQSEKMRFDRHYVLSGQHLD